VHNAGLPFLGVFLVTIAGIWCQSMMGIVDLSIIVLLSSRSEFQVAKGLSATFLPWRQSLGLLECLTLASWGLATSMRSLLNSDSRNGVRYEGPTGECDAQ